MLPSTLPYSILILGVCAPVPASAQAANPYEGDPAAIRAGSALYANRCAECHGADAKGFSGPDLTLLWAFGTDDEYVFDAIRLGIPGSIMPSSSALENEIWAMVAYVKRLSTVTQVAYDEGDAERGRELFAETCARCHRLHGVGGRLGPDLSRVTAIRSREALVRAIREPAASVGRGYRAVTLLTTDGTRVRGATKAEDAFSIQVMDTDERIQGYVKSELEELTYEDGSLMPEFGPERLGAGDLDDLLSYLASLREARPDRR